MKQSRSHLIAKVLTCGALVGCTLPSLAQQKEAKTITPVNAVGATQPSEAQEVSGRVVYEWNPSSYKAGTGNPWTSEAITRPDGKVAQRFEVKGANITGETYSNYLQVPVGTLLDGHQYTAYIKYEIVTPTQVSDAFYMFARSLKLGIRKDFWQKWNGDKGRVGIAKLTMSLTGIKSSDDWAFYVGCKGQGAIIIDSVQIVEGDGLHSVAAVAKPAVAKPVTAKPSSLSLPCTFELPTGAKPLVLNPPDRLKGLKLQAKDFGLTADGASGAISTEVAATNSEAIKRAIEACRERKASVLSFEPGVYRFYSDEAIPLVDLRDLTFDGRGSQFIFQKYRAGLPALAIKQCQRVVIKNLKIDWDWEVAPLGSLAQIVSVTPDGLGCDLTFPELTEKQFEATKKAPWVQLIGMDAATLTRNGIGHPKVSVTDLQQVGPKTLRVTFKEPTPLLVGSSYCVRHFYYGFDAFGLSDSNHLWFDNITIYSIPGMGWHHSGDMSHWKLTNCQIVRPQGSRRPLTTTADGFHISQSQGNLTLENCEFTGCGDDPINIHDNCYQGVERVADMALKLVNFPRHRLRIVEGDSIELFHSDYSPFNFVSRVTKVEHVGKDTTLTLATALPAEVPPLSIIRNHRFDTNNVRIANCKFIDCNGRSILLSARNATIENNLFKNCIGTAIQMHTEIVGTLWAEGSGVSNLVVRGNIFDNTSYENRYENAVVYAGAKLPIGVTAYPLFKNVLIEKNRFIDSSGPSVSLFSAQNVIVRDNHISAPHPRPMANQLSNSLYADYSSDLVFSDNSWDAKPKIGQAAVLFGSRTTQNVKAERNVLSAR